jgi:L-threonylcarbamoyladenylate synthase
MSHLPNSFNKSSAKTSIEGAISALIAGDVVAIPTETVYGLAAKISSETSIRKIFTSKERPFFDPLIVHVISIAQAKTLVVTWPRSAQILAEAFWPGPLTLVMKKQLTVSDLITSGLDTVGIRWPQHSVAQKIIHGVGEPIAAPSANKFGKTSPSEAQHVFQEFGDSIKIVDGGPCKVGIESTILKIVETETSVELTLLRAGVILPTQLTKALMSLGKTVRLLQPGQNIEAPGQVKHHYMPPMPLVFLNRRFWLKLGESQKNLNHELGTAFQFPVFLSLSADATLAARELYGKLREVSTVPNDLIVFIKENYHIGEPWAAVLDRINRASTYHREVD